MASSSSIQFATPGVTTTTNMTPTRGPGTVADAVACVADRALGRSVTSSSVLVKKTEIDEMVDTRGPGAPTTAEMEALAGSLAKVDAPVLHLAHSSGVKVDVVHKGADFTSLGAIRPRSAQSYRDNLPQMHKFADEVAGTAAPFDHKLAALSKQRAALPPDPQGMGIGMWGGVSDAELTPDQIKGQKLDKQIRALEQAKVEAVSKHFTPGESPAIPFMLPSDMGERSGPMGAIQAHTVAQMPKSTAMMAEFVGAKTPEERKEYCQLVEGINGERLSKARTEALAQLEKDGWDKNDLAKLKADPSQIPIDLDKNNILVPDLFYAPDGKGGQQRLNYHDATSMLSWADGQGKARPSIGADQEKGSVLNGEFFEDKNRILVQSDRLDHSADPEDTLVPVHELAHSLRNIVKTRDPQFYEGWEKKLQVAYDKAHGAPWTGEGAMPPAGTGSVTAYALTNLGEYHAEGVAKYYDDPEGLQLKDPALYQLTKEFIDRANVLGNQP